jgi:hypothetical protein
MSRHITIVSGLPRTGTSMMMKMLEAGGMEVVVDNLRQADVDNLGGYYEFEKVKKIKDDKSWLKDAEGKAFKMVSLLLYHLPSDYSYKVVFMEREMSEMLASQNKMLERKGQDTSKGNDEESKRLFGKHLDKIKDWLKQQKNIEVMYVSYNEAVGDPYKIAETVNYFLGGTLDVDKMARVFNKDMYRNRAVSTNP